MLESLFNKVAGPKVCFPLSFAKYFYTKGPVAVTHYSGLFNFASNSSGTFFVKKNYHEFMQI